MAFRMSFGRISLDDDVSPFDVAQAPEFFEKRSPRGAARDRSDHVGREYRSNDRDPSWLCHVLGPRGSSCGCEQQTDCEIPTPHSITSSARPRIAGGIVRPSELAVFRFMGTLVVLMWSYAVDRCRNAYALLPEAVCFRVNSIDRTPDSLGTEYSARLVRTYGHVARCDPSQSAFRRASTMTSRYAGHSR